MEEKLNNKEKTLLDIERDELNLLVQRGIKFDITIKARKPVKGIKGFFCKKEFIEEIKTFEIHEPTLSVLDRLSEITVNMIIDKDDFTNESQDIIANARKTVKDNSLRLARVVAIATLGENYHITEISKSGKVKRMNDDKEIERLTDLFFHSITPSKLAGIASLITNISNLADFISSMQLLSGARTTQPRKESIE